MSDNDWIELDEIDPTATDFPVAQKAAGEWIVIFKVGGKFHAVGRFCAHQRADLRKVGTLLGNSGMLRCSLHGYVYRLESGKCINAPGEDIGSFEVAVEDNRLRVRKTSEGVKSGTAARNDTTAGKN